MDLHTMSFLQIIRAGGPVMWPIIACSVFALALVLEKYWHLYRTDIDTKGLLDRLFEKLKRSETKEALKICDETAGPVSTILKAGILKYDRPREQIVQAMEDASLYEIPRIERNLNALATIAHVTPLMGLLGTVTGMVRCFQTIQAKATAFTPVSPGELAGGIWEALLTTAAGLIVAIPTFIAYNYLASRVNYSIREMEKASTELVNFLTE